MPTLYFLQVAPDGPIKIGCTSGNMIQRIQQIQGGSPHELRWIGAGLGTRDDEQAAHKRLEKHRIRGEWFQPHPEVLQFVESVSGPGFCPDQYLDDAGCRVQREAIRAALRKNRQSIENLTALAGWRGVDRAWWIWNGVPANREYVEALVAALPKLTPRPRRIPSCLSWDPPTAASAETAAA